MKGNEELCARMLRLGFRKAIITSVAGIEGRRIDGIAARLGLDDKVAQHKKHGRLPTSAQVVGKLDRHREGVNFLTIYLGIATNPREQVDIDEFIRAFEVYREITCEFQDKKLSDEILDANFCWVLARDFRGSDLNVLPCSSCNKSYLHRIEDAGVLLACPYCGHKTPLNFKQWQKGNEPDRFKAH